jgi:outer membrane immunogenic protein
MHFSKVIARSISGKITSVSSGKVATSRALVGPTLRLAAMSLVVAGSVMALDGAASADGLPGYSLKGGSYPYVAPYRWTGFYAGLNAGAAWTDSDVSNSVCASGPNCYFATFDPYGTNVNAAGSGHLRDEAFAGGGQLGYNWQTGNLVLGLEGDLDSMRTHESRTASPLVGPSVPGAGLNLSDTVSTNYLATIRGRLGYAWGGNLLTYFTGGVAFTDFKHSHQASEFISPPQLTCTPFLLCDTPASDTIDTGWTIGGGAEWALDYHWSLKAEYLYADFGSVTSISDLNAVGFGASLINHSADLIVQTARVGINYRF